MGFNSAFKGLKFVKNPGNRRLNNLNNLNNLNDPNRPQCVKFGVLKPLFRHLTGLIEQSSQNVSFEIAINPIHFVPKDWCFIFLLHWQAII